MLSDLGLVDLHHAHEGIADVILDALDDALIVVAHDSHDTVVTCNEFARIHGLVRSGRLHAAFVLLTQKTDRPVWHTYLPLPPVEHQGRNWHLRIVPLVDGNRLLWCKPERLAELDFLRRLQRLYSLSDRQCDVLRLVMRGMSWDEIARDLRVSIRTATRHRANLLEAFSAKTDVEIVLRCQEIRDRP